MKKIYKIKDHGKLNRRRIKVLLDDGNWCHTKKALSVVETSFGRVRIETRDAIYLNF